MFSTISYLRLLYSTHEYFIHTVLVRTVTCSTRSKKRKNQNLNVTSKKIVSIQWVQ